ncbi:MAG: hypothetical protein ACFE95_13420 [Candidatus Hodarchaeota archaeon]
MEQKMDGFCIGTPCGGKNDYGMWFGITPELASCVSQRGRTNKDVIFHCADGDLIPYNRWDGSEWILIELDKLKDNLIIAITNMLKILGYQLKSESSDRLILFFTHVDLRYGISIGVRIVGIDFIENKNHDVRMTFMFSYNIIDVSTKEFGWNDKSKFSKYEKELLEIKELIENKSKKIITLN